MQRLGKAAECLETLRAANASPSGCSNRNLYPLLQNRDFYWRALRVASRKRKAPIADKANDAIKDGVDHAIVEEISTAMRDQRYRFTPIPPPSSLKPPPPPSLADHLVYETLAMILCAIYGIAYTPHHPKKADVEARHAAMKLLQENAMGTTWMSVNKIEPAFMSTNRMVLLHMLRKRIEDKKFLAVVWAALQAGCMHELTTVGSMSMDALARNPRSEQDQEHTLAAVLSQIYLSHLDEFVYEVLESFDVAQLKAVHGVQGEGVQG